MIRVRRIDPLERRTRVWLDGRIVGGWRQAKGGEVVAPRHPSPLSKAPG